MTNYLDDLRDDFMQYLMDELNKSYSQYKKEHPDFAKIVEEQLEGKTDAEFEAQIIHSQTCPYCGEYNFKDEIVDGHCHECLRDMRCSCGEMLLNRDMCQSCGKINV